MRSKAPEKGIAIAPFSTTLCGVGGRKFGIFAPAFCFAINTSPAWRVSAMFADLYGNPYNLLQPKRPK
ncbi:MAG: hypothetical protein ACRD5G_11910 [Candidatus Acidiferrales bacterium]